jgi:hypothetical protein
MTNQPEAAWVEAAREAANRTYDALGSIDDIALPLDIVKEEEATGTNSLDTAFLDYLASGAHLTDRFLANAQ